MKQIKYRKLLMALLCIAGLGLVLGSCKSNDVASNRADCEASSNCTSGSGVADEDDSPDAYYDFETEPSGLTHSAGNNANWYRTTTPPAYQNNYSYRSGSIGNNQKSCFETSGSYTSVSFKYRTSSESGFDYLKFYINGIVRDSFSGEGSWTLKSDSITSSSTNTFKWCYEKDGATIGGSDLVQVDIISLYY